MGEELIEPTLIAFGTPEQQRRFLPAIKAVDELWCQGYSEPGAGSDLAAVATTAALDGDEWVITGQKIWTSLAHVADWCFLLARTQAGSRRSEGLSYLLVPMRQSGITVRPIRQLTGTSEFNEVFFDGARTRRDLVVGAPGDGWRVALGAPSMVAREAPYDLDDWQRLFLFSRADTIYGGSDEIQRNIIAARALGLPRQDRP